MKTLVSFLAYAEIHCLRMSSVSSVEQYRVLMNHIFHTSYMSHQCEELVIQNDTYESYTVYTFYIDSLRQGGVGCQICAYI